MNINEFFTDVIVNSENYAKNLEFDAETKKAINNFISVMPKDISSDPEGYLITVLMVGYLLKIYLDKVSLEKLNWIQE